MTWDGIAMHYVGEIAQILVTSSAYRDATTSRNRIIITYLAIYFIDLVATFEVVLL